eukprot:1734093-Rhodomonas_salina.5
MAKRSRFNTEAPTAILEILPGGPRANISAGHRAIRAFVMSRHRNIRAYVRINQSVCENQASQSAL